ncbi:GGDEF domain-containing protein [Sphingomonas montanisoli]|uniref:diguanylate cyclase n=1 Tax=Sphingomonas montanisoli TaxID=2606412 RepID=A0A5D9CBU3_9SPHN|nr:GGDEF domain-containing protein [Sphingomonas montanisoli]TZG28777.1 GGDEF domain-containing protein [Sphingomonas montanisoli]
MSTDFFILTILLMVNVLVATALLLAARSLGQPLVARLLAAAFCCNVVMYIVDVLYLALFRDSVALLCLLNALGTLGTMFAAAGMRVRVGLPPKIWIYAAVQVLTLALTLYFSLVDPNKGARGAIVPLLASSMIVWGTAAMWRPGRKLLLGERPMIVTSLLMVTTETIGGVALFLRGREPDAFLENVYMFVVFIGLPAMTVALGMFALYLLASDLADRLRRTAETDSLTGAPNRRAIEATGRRVIDEARTAGTPLCAALCDLDQFKYINDRFGHALGDEVLCNISLLFERHGSKPLHGRYGGEEFLLFFPGRDLTDVHGEVENLRRDVMALAIAGLPIQITASFGLTQLAPLDTLATLIKRADQALYASKQTGRNRTTTADMPPARARQELASSRA